MNDKHDSIFEVLDNLIFHLNTTKNMFSILIVSAFILAPLSFILTSILLLHPRFLRFLLTKQPDIGIMLLLYSIISIVLASIWLYIGIREHMFFAKWDNRFKKFLSLKRQMDKELDES